MTAPTQETSTVWHAKDMQGKTAPLIMSEKLPIPLEACSGTIGLTRIRGVEISMLDAKVVGETVLHVGEASASLACHIMPEGDVELRLDGFRREQHYAAGAARLSLVPNGFGRVRMRPQRRVRAVSFRFDPLCFEEMEVRSTRHDAIIERAASGQTFDPVVTELRNPIRFLRIARDIISNPYRGPAARLYLESRVLELSACLTREMTDNDGAPDALSRREIDRLHETRDLLLCNLAAPPTLEELCRAAGMNRNKLGRGFQALFGASPFALLREARLDLACQLLEEGHLSVEQIAEATGYAHANNFTLAFRHRFGMTPSAWRANRSP